LVFIEFANFLYAFHQTLVAKNTVLLFVVEIDEFIAVLIRKVLTLPHGKSPPFLSWLFESTLLAHNVINLVLCIGLWYNKLRSKPIDLGVPNE
jgi:hypothetical protein